VFHDAASHPSITKLSAVIHGLQKAALQIAVITSINDMYPEIDAVIF
jgi:hypothetical protein